MITDKLKTIEEPVIDKAQTFSNYDFATIAGLELTDAENKKLNIVYKRLIASHFTTGYLEAIAEMTKTMLKVRAKKWHNALERDGTHLPIELFDIVRCKNTTGIRRFIRHFFKITEQDIKRKD